MWAYCSAHIVNNYTVRRHNNDYKDIDGQFGEFAAFKETITGSEIKYSIWVCQPVLRFRIRIGIISLDLGQLITEMLPIFKDLICMIIYKKGLMIAQWYKHKKHEKWAFYQMIKIFLVLNPFLPGSGPVSKFDL